MAYASTLSLRELRQDLHAHPESGWKEFRTTALIAAALDEREFTLHLGPDAVAEDERLGVPDDDAVAAAVERAREEDAPEAYLDRMGDITGLVAEKRFGNGPTVGVRVDMDALERTESSDEKHRPAKLGFASTHPNEMHACGHDGHTAIGLGIARALDDDGGFDGTLRLFFQPAEEGGRGGKPMSETDLLADIDYFLALHLGLGNPTGTVIAAYENPLSNAKLDVTFEGAPSHAGNAPNEGRNALHAATAAVQNLYGIPRHADGTTRINVGKFESPNPQNIIAEEARLLGDDVLRVGRFELPDVDAGRPVGVARNPVEVLDRGRRRVERVAPLVGRVARVARRALECHVEFRVRKRVLVGGDDGSRGVAEAEVEREEVVDIREQVGLAHRFAAAAALLRRLEEQSERAVEPAVVVEGAGDTEADSGVAVVAARVHLVGVRARESQLRGAVFLVARLGAFEGVHVDADADGRPVSEALLGDETRDIAHPVQVGFGCVFLACAFDRGRDRVVIGDAQSLVFGDGVRAEVECELAFVECGGDEGCRAELLPPGLGVGVKVLS